MGAASTEKVDIRVICATNRSPLEEVQAKRFRQDLYFRLHVLPIHMPALRERGRDIVDIAQHFLVQFSAEEDKRFERISADAEQVLLQHDWPGNVRELQNAVRQCVVLNDTTELSAQMLLPVTGGGGVQPAVRDVGATRHGKPVLEMDVEELRQAQSRRAGMELWQIEKEAIESTIAACKGSIPKAAKILGVSPSTIYRKRESWQDEAAG